MASCLFCLFIATFWETLLSLNVTQAKTPLSSFARASYPGSTGIPSLLVYSPRSLNTTNTSQSMSMHLDWVVDLLVFRTRLLY